MINIYNVTFYLAVLESDLSVRWENERAGF
jgi:hypothetical protein